MEKTEQTIVGTIINICDATIATLDPKVPQLQGWD